MRPALGNAERIADLGATGLDLLLGGSKHADTGGIDVLDRLVDDRVGLDLHALLLRGVASLALRTDAEADDDGIRRGGKRDVGLGDGADGGVDDVDTDLGLVHLADGVGKRLDGALGVGLDDQVELLELVLAHLLEQGLKGDVLDLVLLLDTGLESALLSKVAGIAGVLEDAELVAGCRNPVQTEDLDGVGRTRLVLVLTVLVEHGANEP